VPSLSLSYRAQHFRKNLFNRKLRRVNHNRVVRFTKRRVCACGVALVARVDVCERLVESQVSLLQTILFVSSLRSLFRPRRKKEFHVRFGEDHSAYVSSFKDDAATLTHLALTRDKRPTHSRNRRDDGRRLAHLFRAYLVGNVAPV